jgi:hypothetical protein
MTDFNIRSESVDVEQIMGQIRARIREKRGVDYTEEQIRELASVRLEKFLDSKNLRSDLLDQFRRSRPAIQAEPAPIDPPYSFDDQTLFASHRGPMRAIRRLLKPILKLFFNPNTLNQVLHAQAQFNADLLKRERRRKIEFEQSRSEWNALYYEVLHNLVLETTRNGIELKNMKMRLEALASRLDFSERRVRALEGVVQYRPEVVRPRPSASRDRDGDRDRGRERPTQQDTGAVVQTDETAAVLAGEATPGQVGGSLPADQASRRRRRRRRGRRGAGPSPAASLEASDQTVTGDESAVPGDGGFDEGEGIEGPAVDDAPVEGRNAAREHADDETPNRLFEAHHSQEEPAPDAPDTPRDAYKPATPSDPEQQ